MTTYANPNLSPYSPVASAVGPIIHDRRVFNLAATAGHRPPSLIIGNDIVLFEVPAGHALVPHLCRFAFPQIDSHGTPTGQASIGTAAAPASLRAAAAVNAVRVDSGEDLLQPEAVIGHPTRPTPVVLRFTAAVATLAPTGQIVCDFALRAYRSDIDGVQV